jgi:hypothetical protein
MITAYVGGAYRSKYGLPGIIINILKARKLAKWLWSQGYAVICPHMNSALMGGKIPEELFMQGYLEILKKVDLMVVQGKYWESMGTMEEIDQALKAKIPVYFWDKQWYGLMPIKELYCGGIAI